MIGHAATIAVRARSSSNLDANSNAMAEHQLKNDNPAFMLNGPLDVSFENLPIPEIENDEVLLEIAKTGICGSDVHFYSHAAMGQFKVTEPMALGHETSATVIKLGPKVKRLNVGDRVALEPGIVCRVCPDCKRGEYQICEFMRFAATPPDHGTLSRYYKLPEDLCFPLPEHVSLSSGALMEPLSVAVHAVASVGNMRPGQNVGIMGAGPVGLLCMAVARALGAGRVIGVDINESRLEFAKEYSGADTFLCPPMDKSLQAHEYSSQTAAKLRSDLSIPTRGHGSLDLIVDATGAETCCQIALEVIRPGGTYVQLGFGPQRVSVPLSLVITKEIRIKGSWRYGPGDYPQAIELVARKAVDLEKLITHRFPFTETKEAFETAKRGKGADGKAVIKVVIDAPL